MRPTWLTRLVSSPVAAQEFEKSQPFAFCLAGDISILHAILALMPLSGPDLLNHSKAPSLNLLHMHPVPNRFIPLFFPCPLATPECTQAGQGTKKKKTTTFCCFSNKSLSFHQFPQCQ